MAEPRQSRPGGGAPLGVVLAGGAGARLGRAKPIASLAGRTLIEHPLATLRTAGLEAVVAAKPDSPLPELDVPVWDEPPEPRHPLTGVASALRRAGRPAVVVGCDMPFLSPELLAWLAARSEPLVVARTGGRLQPLLARYSAELAEALERAALDGVSAWRALRDLDPVVVEDETLRKFGDPEWLVFSVNTPDDLRRAQRRMSWR